MIGLSNRRLTISRDISQPPEKVWELLVNTSHWPSWGPSVTAVECSERHIGAGSRGRLRTPFGLWLPFVITSFSTLRSWDWQVGPIAATGHSLTALGDGRCRLSFDMPWWAVWYLPVCWYALRRIEALAANTVY